jgi:hypothetical protein
LDSNLKRFRNDLTKSSAIKKFSCLLISSQTKVQLNVLKFYASICFESLEACKLILNADFYDVSLIELITTYLSRENVPELQLYAAKCLTNLCRCSLLISKRNSMTKDTKTHEHQNMDVVSELISTTTQSTTTPPQKQPLSSHHQTQDTSNNKPQKVDPATYAAFKSVNYKSQLIKNRTLPTLIRLCCTYSLSYRFDSISSSSSSSYQSLASKVAGKELNIFLLTESISTLTYLI